MFWICAENSFDNTGKLLLLLSRAHRVEAFSAPHTTPPANGLWVHKELRGDTDGTADPN